MSSKKKYLYCQTDEKKISIHSSVPKNAIASHLDSNPAQASENISKRKKRFATFLNKWDPIAAGYTYLFNEEVGCAFAPDVQQENFKRAMKSLRELAEEVWMEKAAAADDEDIRDICVGLAFLTKFLNHRLKLEKPLSDVSSAPSMMKPFDLSACKEQELEVKLPHGMSFFVSSIIKLEHKKFVDAHIHQSIDLLVRRFALFIFTQYNLFDHLLVCLSTSRSTVDYLFIGYEYKYIVTDAFTKGFGISNCSEEQKSRYRFLVEETLSNLLDRLRKKFNERHNSSTATKDAATELKDAVEAGEFVPKSYEVWVKQDSQSNKSIAPANVIAEAEEKDSETGSLYEYDD